MPRGRGSISFPGRLTMLARILAVSFGYFCGSISFAYLVARLWRGIDLRKYGSRKLSGSNVYHHVAKPAIVLVGLLDVAKAVLPTWLALDLGLGLPTATSAGLAAMIGHNWSLFLGLTGGRGLGSALGMLLVVFPWGVLWELAWVALGRLTPTRAAVPALIGVLTLPVLAHFTSQAEPVVWGCVGILAVALVKRLEANREPIPKGGERWATLWRRMVLDRDIADFDAWMQRTPERQRL